MDFFRLAATATPPPQLLREKQEARDAAIKTASSSLNTLDESVQTAAINGDVEKLKVLLDKGNIHINASNYSGITALHYAAENNHLTAVQELLGHGASVDVPDINGRTPLYYVSVQGHADIAKELVENGADPHFIDKNGTTPLELAKAEAVEHPTSKRDDTVMAMQRKLGGGELTGKRINRTRKHKKKRASKKHTSKKHASKKRTSKKRASKKRTSKKRKY